MNTYPEAAPDDAILGTISFAVALGCKVHVSTFAVDIPSVGLPLGGYLINVEGMTRPAEDRSRTECKRLQALVEKTRSPGFGVSVTSHEVVMGGAPSSAATEARYFDLSLVPWSAEAVATQDMAQSLVFGSGLAVILFPPTAETGTVDHIAIAWDESRVAARALGDALRILPPGGKASVLTVHDEKALNGAGLAQTLASSLDRRGYDAKAADLRDVGLAGGAGQQAVMPVAVEAIGQDMDQETANELIGGQSHDLLSVTGLDAVILPAERDGLGISADQAVVRDRHAVRVAAEVGQHRLGATERRFGVDHPFSFAERGQPSGEGPGVGKPRQTAEEEQLSGVVEGEQVPLVSPELRGSAA